MNVKITERSVTFKITEEEMIVLSMGKPLEKIIPIGGNDFAMVIDPNPENLLKDINGAPLKLILDKDESCLMLCTSKEQIQKLMDMGRSKEGLSAHTDDLEVFLQVDLKADSRPRRKG
jgi:hypothetical protein